MTRFIPCVDPEGCGIMSNPHDHSVPPGTLVARCSECGGYLLFRWGMPEAPCEKCGARCGVAVAYWLEVVPKEGIN